MFSKKHLGLVVLAALLLGFVVGGAVLAQGSAPGSEVDPWWPRAMWTSSCGWKW